MIWDKLAGLYDVFENLYNKKVYQNTGKCVAKYVTSEDRVLECACGTGAISVQIAPNCKKLYASDYSKGMLNQAKKKLQGYDNVVFKQSDITALKARDNSFDVVIAGNVIHLLDNPGQALKELIRVCKNGGKVIIPTYINASADTSRNAVKLLEKIGVKFNRQFDADSYKAFFEQMGYYDVCYEIVEGRMACDIAVIKVNK